MLKRCVRQCDGEGLGRLFSSVVELSNKTLLMLLRSTDNFIFASRSTDRGKHWSKPLKTTVNNPDSKLSALRLSSGLHVLAFNDHFRAFTGHAKVTYSPLRGVVVGPPRCSS